MGTELLTVKELNVGFVNKGQTIPVLSDVEFTVKKGETLCIVGESGCGKSLTSLAIMGLIPKNGEIMKGEILFKGEDLVKKTKKEISQIRGKQISMIFQEPMTSLNPVHTVGKQIAESVRLHEGVGKKQAMEKAVEMLRLVGIPSPEKRVHDYPFEMSGGMRQRVMIAMALVCNPNLLIADEPTTALDVTTQAQILGLMGRLKKELDMSIVMITHDLGVVSQIADRVIVMYAGKVIEVSETMDLIENPKHPYTRGLIESIPKLHEEQDDLPTIKGSVPGLNEMPKGCRFSTRCLYARQTCHEVEPTLTGEGQHKVSCWLHSPKWENLE
ncbi:ABC transporter ATP-binding protein [Sporosarcina koreensis]|uniref:ABC transporter ATP-binding protein n=1 Tax=Sporosarcina koreensis TaxID=334735 RepID=UPI00075A51CA|nr:ABC transporter ATP-binding protein [Sporosarcina koreensis]